jgi:uncharacterized protein (TIGR03663 family)
VGQARLNPSALWIRRAAFLLVALLGLILRLPQLDARPMHTDEAINSYIVGQLLAGQKYTYDAQDRHGPALAALALPLARLQGAKTFAELTEAELRRTPVAAGTATILLFGVAAEIFGFVPCVIAALLFAGAPLTVYYDRYFIHESLFVAFTFGLILSSWNACTLRSAKLAVLAAACTALMLCCKETAVLHFAALTAAALLYWLWNLRRKSLRDVWRPRALLTALLVFLLLCVALFTWFGTNWSAMGALNQAAPNFAARAAGEGHAHPFWYYAHLLAGDRSGALTCALAGIGLMLAVRKREASPFALLAYYAVFVFVLYSAIPYKTPWLAMNFWLPITLFVGLAAASVWRVPVKRPVVRIVLRSACLAVAGVAAVLIAHDTRQRVFLYPADEGNPYAYAHTSEDLLGLPTELAQIAHQEGLASPRIAVIAADPWPLPWYLRQYAQVGYWQPGQPVGQADFYITSTDAANQYADQLKNFHADFFGERPGVLILLWSPTTQ